MWAEADVDDATQWLRRLASDAELRVKMGATAAEDIATRLSPKTFAVTVADLLAREARR